MIDVCAVIERETGQRVTADTPIGELNVDSLEYIDLMLAIEKEAERDSPVLTYGNFATVGDIVRELA